MFRKSSDGTLADALSDIERRLERLDIILMIKDPGAGKSADAYEGLRRQVVASAGERTAHLAHLAEIDAALQRGEGPNELSLLVRDLFDQAGLARVSDPNVREAFEVVAGEGDDLVVLEPAYVEPATGRLVKQGRARADRPATPADPDGNGDGDGR
jgi:hypothetical protein